MDNKADTVEEEALIHNISLLIFTVFNGYFSTKLELINQHYITLCTFLIVIFHFPSFSQNMFPQSIPASKSLNVCVNVKCSCLFFLFP